MERRDPLAPELLGITRVASQSALARCFQGFTSAGGNLRCFRPLWQWGVAVGYTRQGVKPCLHPLLAVIAEVRLVARLWLRPGNTSCGGNSTAFFLDLWENCAWKSSGRRRRR